MLYLEHHGGGQHVFNGLETPFSKQHRVLNQSCESGRGSKATSRPRQKMLALVSGHSVLVASSGVIFPHDDDPPPPHPFHRARIQHERGAQVWSGRGQYTSKQAIAKGGIGSFAGEAVGILLEHFVDLRVSAREDVKGEKGVGGHTPVAGSVP